MSLALCVLPFALCSLPITFAPRNVQLVLDIGNTRTKAGIFDGFQLVRQAIWQEPTLSDVLAFIGGHRIGHTAVSSVAEARSIFADDVRNHFNPLELNALTTLPFVNTYTTPETLGKDRLSAAAGAHVLFPQTDCLVVDGGTCLKYDLMAADGRYLGGNIAPGLAMRIRAMHVFTARLPEVPVELPDNPVGNSTRAALQNGALLGALLEVQGFARLFATYLQRPLCLVLTGGDGQWIFDRLEQPNKVFEPHLTLYGLNHILTFNIPNAA